MTTTFEKAAKMNMDEELNFDSDMDDDEEDYKKRGPDEKKFMFRRELRSMLYGYGDEKVQYPHRSILLVPAVPQTKSFLFSSRLILAYPFPRSYHHAFPL
ncbi:hypothetical protein L596_004266 [Steinernema carpocapsae]|uniref:Uncharacterized protein n=1 Tax=Steinernema carpocapsae TaxID=34508 RepID=A0A4U8UWX0_STECR|nr:hypothetical protein L596_004266 [Steinernema carpocapsae]